MDFKLSAADKNIIIVISEFNEKIIERLLKGSMGAYFHYHGLKENLKIVRVPGAFEIPGTINQILHHKNTNAIVALGSVIRGDTPHFDFVAGESAHGISEISRNVDIPIINGVLTTDNIDQALERSQPDGQNKGWDAIETALQTIDVYRSIQTSS